MSKIRSSWLAENIDREYKRNEKMKKKIQRQKERESKEKGEKKK